MAKRSKVHTQQTVEQILDEALKQILTIGFDAMSYTTLSDATGISRTGISHHFPRKSDFLERLDSRIANLFISQLDFSSIQALQASWASALNLAPCRAILRLFFAICGSAKGPVGGFRAVSMVRETAQLELKSAGETVVNNLLGKSAVRLLNERASA